MPTGSFYEERLEPIILYALRNKSLIVGLGLLGGLLLFTVLGLLTYPKLDDYVSTRRAGEGQTTSTVVVHVV